MQSEKKLLLVKYCPNFSYLPKYQVSLTNLVNNITYYENNQTIL